MAARVLFLAAAAWQGGPLPLLSPKQPLSCRRSLAPQSCTDGTAKSAAREVDDRGFVLPQVGDIVKVPSKWPGEWDVAQVDFVQTVESRQTTEVDLLPLKSIGQSLYRAPGRKPALVRADIAKLGRLNAEYVQENDAYRVDESQLLPLTKRRAADPSVTEQSLAEYAALKAELLREAFLAGVAGYLVATPIYGGDVASAYGAGVLAGCVYLFLLQTETDSVGGAVPPPKALALATSGRLLVPVVLMSVLALKQRLSGVEVAGALSSLPKETFLAAAAGFLTYKAPLLVRQYSRALLELVGGETEDKPMSATEGLTTGMPTGSLGFAARLFRQQQKQREERESGAAPPPPPLQVVLAGPSGVGRSTLVARLLQEEPGRFGFSVSTTTRAPLEGEVDGRDYRFVDRDRFEADVDAGGFIEWAEVGSDLFGTSVDAVAAVAAAGRTCLLSLDVAGLRSLRSLEAAQDTAAAEAEAEAVAGGAPLRPLCIWLAPPSLDALRGRLERTGVKDPSELDRRLARAREDIEFSLNSRTFDLIIVNDNLEYAYKQLRDALDSARIP